MNSYLKFSPKKNIYILALIILGILIKFYNFNAEDFWYDELLSFWVSDPNIGYDETFRRNLEVNDGTQLIFTYLLKLFFLTFGYNPDLGRLLTIAFSIISIPFLIILINKLKIKNSLILFLFLFFFNNYFLSYDHELRTYSLIIYLSILNFIFFLNLFEKKRNLDIFLVGIVNLLGILSHTFFILISISQFIFLFINNKIDRLLIKYFIFHIIIIIFFIIISKDSILIQVDKKVFWIPGLDIKFLGDFFFSRFFSSKIMGYIYLTIFILILFIQRQNMFKIRNYNFYFLILISVSYTVPFFYGLIKIPVLTDRYIIFIVIPIILIITTGIMNIKNLNLKVFLIAIILISTISDYTLRIKKNEITKPEFKKAIKFITNSRSKNILINNKNINNEQDFKVIKNYLMSLNNSLIIKNSIEENENNIWKLCYLPASDFECAINDNSIKFLQTETKSFELVTINLYNIK